MWVGCKLDAFDADLRLCTEHFKGTRKKNVLIESSVKVFRNVFVVIINRRYLHLNWTTDE